MRRRVLALGAAVVVGAAACSSPSHRADPSTTLAPTATAAPAGPDPDIVPTVITPAYVDAVFRVLNHIRGDAIRQIVRTRSIDAQVTSDLKAIYGEPLLDKEIKAANEAVDGITTNVRRPPGDVVTTVTRLISSSPTCIFVEATSDFGSVLVKQPPAPPSEYWRLSSKQNPFDSPLANPTPWILTQNDVFLQATNLSDQCAKR